MDAQKMIRTLSNIGIGILLPLFLVGVFWFLTGSLEMNPTPEQMEKARMAAGTLMLVTGIPCVLCIICRIKFRKS
jgi:hypothetical protein